MFHIMPMFRLCLQDKKKLEEERKKELDALFAVAIKQPKVPPGEADMEETKS